MKNFIEIQTSTGKVTLNVNYIVSVYSKNKTIPKVFGQNIPERVVRMTYISMSNGKEYETATPYETIIPAIDRSLG